MDCKTCKFREEVLKIIGPELDAVGHVCYKCPAEDKSESAYILVPEYFVRRLLRIIVKTYVSKNKNVAETSDYLGLPLNFIKEVVKRCPSLSPSDPYLMNENLGFSLIDVSEYLEL